MEQKEELNITNATNKELYYLGFEKVEEFMGKVARAKIKVATKEGQEFIISLKKPKTTKTNYVSGVPVEKVEQATVEEFLNNDRVQELEAFKNKYAKTKIIANYSILEKDNDGETVKYRFIRSIYSLKPVKEQDEKAEEQDFSKENY